jgi:4-azaleucine resistance transporter AzlC
MQQKRHNRQQLKTIIISTIPVMTGYIVLGTAFGILLADKGYSVWWALLMSTTIFAGSMQFVSVDLLSGGATLVSAAIMTLLVNARHLVYGISMLNKYRSIGKAKPYLIFSLTDETYALLCGGIPEGVDEKRYYLLVSALDQFYWIAGSVLGALIGGALTMDTTGIDFAMTALFVVIFVEQWLTEKDHYPALLGLGISLFCLVIWGAERFLIPAMVLIVLVLSVRELIRNRREAA